MTFNNPLGLFNDAQIQQLNAKTLVSLKEDILNALRSSEGAIIERGNTQYSKIEVEQIFDVLQNDLDLHLKIYDNKPLYNFLTTGALDFFNSKEAKEKLPINPSDHKKTNQFIANKLTPIIPNLLLAPNFNILKTLQHIKSYTDSMQTQEQAHTYEQTYSEQRTIVDQLLKDFPHPFADKSSLKLHPDIDNKINVQHYNCFQYLPENFKDIAHSYGAWCHNEVVNAAFRREKRFEKFDLKDLETIHKAMLVAGKVNTSDAFKGSTRSIKQFLNDQSGASKSRLPVGFIIFGILSLLCVGLFFGNKYAQQMNKDAANEQSPSNNNTRTLSPKALEKKKEKAMNRALAKDKKQTLEKYVGDQAPLWGATFTNDREQENYEQLNFDVALFPTNYEDFRSLIPQKYFDKYIKRKEKQFVLSFQNPDFPGMKMRHRVKAKYLNQKVTDVVYDKMLNKSKKDKLKLHTARFSSKAINLKGTISRYNNATTSIVDKSTFDIRYDQAEHDRLKSEGKLDTGQPFDKYQPYSITGVEDENLKNVILNNLAEVHNRRLKLGNYYTLDDIAYYTPSTSTNQPINFSINTVDIGKASLTFSRGSVEDDMGIIELNGKDFQIRYFVRTVTKKFLGMNMVTQNDITKQMEVIQVFYQ